MSLPSRQTRRPKELPLYRGRLTMDVAKRPPHTCRWVLASSGTRVPPTRRFDVAEDPIDSKPEETQNKAQRQRNHALRSGRKLGPWDGEERRLTILVRKGGARAGRPIGLRRADPPSFVVFPQN
jgi:hypothetical protein